MGIYENSSNGKIDVNNTYISTNEIEIIAGDYKNFLVELRTCLRFCKFIFFK